MFIDEFTGLTALIRSTPLIIAGGVNIHQDERVDGFMNILHGAGLVLHVRGSTIVTITKVDTGVELIVYKPNIWEHSLIAADVNCQDRAN